MKFLMHPAITAIGLSVLCFLTFLGPLISPNHLWVYHCDGAPAVVFLPVLLNVGLVGALFTFALLAAEKPGHLRFAVWSGLLIATPAILLEDCSQLLAWRLPHRPLQLLILLLLVAYAIILARWRPSRYPSFEPVQLFVHTLLAFAGLAAILVLADTAWCFAQAIKAESLRPLHSAGSRQHADASTEKPRIIWIILDELSYEQVYERRFPGLELPNFDQLAAQSTMFTQVRPAAERTEYAIPSFLTGLPVNQIHAGADGSLLQLHLRTGAWKSFRSDDTIFRDALDRGYSTGVAGWYIPYCRILAATLDRCHWTFAMNADSWMLSTASSGSNFFAPWRHIASLFLPQYRGQLDTQSAQAHIADYQHLSAAADDLLADDSVSFLLLHIPAPHPGAIYNRRTGALTTQAASYVDNLALADLYLGHVRQVLLQRGEWDSSTVVVMGDHSWRTRLLWYKSPTWAPEDQVASHGGRFDDRPAYLVKLPHQRTPLRIAIPYDAVRTRSLLKALLSHTIRCPDDLATFAQSPQPQSP